MYEAQIKVKAIVNTLTADFVLPKNCNDHYIEIVERAKTIENKTAKGKTIGCHTIVSKTIRNGYAVITLCDKYGNKSKIDFSLAKTCKGYRVFKTCERLHCKIWIAK